MQRKQILCCSEFPLERRFIEPVAKLGCTKALGFAEPRIEPQSPGSRGKCLTPASAIKYSTLGRGAPELKRLRLHVGCGPTQHVERLKILLRSRHAVAPSVLGEAHGLPKPAAAASSMAMPMSRSSPVRGWRCRLGNR